MTFARQSKGVYTADGWRFVLERVSNAGWRLRERGKLLGYKPGKARTATERSPLWLQTDSARGAVAWAKHVLAGMGVS